MIATWDPRCGFGFRSIQTSKAAAAYQPDVLYPIRTREPLLVQTRLQHSADEPRTITMGFTPTGQMVVIVTSVAIDGSIRIISARRATKRERHAFEGD